MTVLLPRVEYPFKPNLWHTIGELRTFERRLSAARQENSSLSKEWRVPQAEETKRWHKLREETYSIKLLADHKAFEDTATFRLKPYGYPAVDAEIVTASEQFELQITIADPIWAKHADGIRHGGYDHRLAMEALNRYDVVHGSGRFRRVGDEIVSDLQAKSPDDEWDACFRGLLAALAKKSRHVTRGCRLLVHTRGYFLNTIDFGYENVIKSVVDGFFVYVNVNPFESIYFVDEHSSAYFEVSESNLQTR